MNVAPHHAEQWIKLQDRLLLSDTEQFLSEPIPILLNANKATGIYQRRLNNIWQPSIGAELRLLIDRNAVGNGAFLYPQPAVHPWIINGILWKFTGNGTLRKTPGGSTADTVYVDNPLKDTKSYVVTFTLSNYTGAGTLTPYCGGAGAGTARSSNGTFTETIVCNNTGSEAFFFQHTTTFGGDISNVSVMPVTAPGALTAALYTAPDALAALRSTESYATIALPSDTKTIVRHLRFLQWLDTASGVDVGLKLAAAYTAGNVYASVWARRYWWGFPASPG